MKKNISIFGALLAALLLAGCSNLIDPPQTVSSGPDGTLIVQIGGEERTLAPDTAALAGLSYKLVIRNGTTVAYNGAFNASSPASYNLQPGTWYIVAEAYSDSGANLVAKAEKTSTITAGQTARVNLVLIPVYTEDVAGTFTYSVSYPDNETEANDIAYTTASLVLLPSGPNSANTGTITINLREDPVRTAGTATKAGTLTLPPGMYTMTLNVTSARQINGTPLAVNRREVVYIYPRLTTSANYAFTANDFTADVRLAGIASVVKYDYTPNTDYKPVEVYAALRTDYEDQPVGKAAIVKNEDTGDYEWELFIPSHYFERMEFGVAFLRFKAEHISDTTKTPLLSVWNNYFVDSQGSNVAISLQARTTTLTSTVTLPGTGGSIDFNPDVVVGGQATITVTNPTNYGLIAAAWRINTTYVGNDAFVSENGKIDITATMPNIVNPVLNVLSGGFFHLKGSLAIISANTEGYAPTKIEAYQQYSTEPGDEQLIAFVTPTQNATVWDYEIPIPAGYISLPTTTGLIRLHTTLTATGEPNQAWNQTTYTYSNMTDANVVPQANISLSTVQGVTVTPVSTDTIRIEWEKADWATGGYEVYESSNTVTPITTALATATSYDYTNASLVPGKYYYFYVRGLKLGGSPGNNSTSVSGRVHWPQMAAAPTVVQGTNPTTGLWAANVSWVRPSATDGGTTYYPYGYIVERNTGSGFEEVYTISSSATTTWLDSTTTLPLVDTTVQYRIIVRSQVAASGNNTPSAAGSVAAPTSTYYYPGWYGLQTGTIATPGQVVYYRIPSGYTNLTYNLYDSDNNPGTISGIGDMYFYAYRGNTRTNQLFSGDRPSGSYNNNSDEVILAVRTLGIGSGTGNFGIEIY